MFFAANDGVADFTVDFNFPYTSFGIPEAPNGGGNGLFMNVNKDATGSAATLNFYPNGQNFSGNFALRFDMFLILKAKARQFAEHREIQELLAGIRGDVRESTPVVYDREHARRLKDRIFDRPAMASRRLAYERLDQLVVDLLLGV
jgi:hypothetical protein